MYFLLFFSLAAESNEDIYALTVPPDVTAASYSSCSAAEATETRLVLYTPPGPIGCPESSSDDETIPKKPKYDETEHNEENKNEEQVLFIEITWLISTFF